MHARNNIREYQYLASALTIITGYYSIRAASIFPKAYEMYYEMFQEAGTDLSVLTTWIFKNHAVLTPIIVIVFLITFISIWCRYKLHALVVAIGIVILAIGAHFMISAAVSPLFHMINTVDGIE